MEVTEDAALSKLSWQASTCIVHVHVHNCKEC